MTYGRCNVCLLPYYAGCKCRPVRTRVPSAQLVTLTISVSRDGTVHSDVQTHDNSYSEVAKGLGAVKKEIERVFAERKDCPYYPASTEEAQRPIVREATELPPEQQREHKGLS